MRLSVAAVGRYAVASTFLAVSVLKLHDFLGPRTVAVPMAILAVGEIGLSVWLVAPSKPSPLAWGVACMFLVVTVVIGLGSALRTGQFDAPCGCLGRAIVISRWQQLLLSGILLTVAGLCLRSACGRGEE